MSISIATLGMFNPCITQGKGVVAGGVIRVPEEKPKPTIKLLKITSKDEDEKKKKIEVMSINSGD